LASEAGSGIRFLLCRARQVRPARIHWCWFPRIRPGGAAGLALIADHYRAGRHAPSVQYWTGDQSGM